MNPRLICVKEDCYAIPKFPSGTFLNTNIMFNSDKALVGVEQQDGS